MRSVVLVATAMVLCAPLGAQERDTTVTIRRRGEADSVVRLEQRRMRGDLREALQKTAREVDVVRSEARRALVQGEQRNRELSASVREARPLLQRSLREADVATARLREMQARALPALRSRVAMIGQRPRLGITVDLEARETDNIGAYVSGVTPGGPAEKAGIRSGDIIRRIGRTSLTDRDGNRRATGESAPGLKLIEVVGKLEAGKAVEIEYRRGSRDHTTKVTPDEATDVFAGSLDSLARVWRRAPSGEAIARLALPGSPRFADSIVRGRMALEPLMARGVYTMAPDAERYAFTFTMGGPLGRLEMTSLNAALGSYFGATEGVLVIKVPDTDNHGLMAGDVITAVDGRKVTSPSQLVRILATYEKNEDLKLQIMRQKRAESISIKLP